jgi:soluble lytic murein transglycosylase-like protein
MKPVVLCSIAILNLVLLLMAGPVFAYPGETNAREQADMRQFLEQAIGESDSFVDRYDAEVWLVDMSARLERYMDDEPERLNLLKAVHREARAADLKPDLVLALIQIESRFDQYAVSRVGAQGLMQVMPFWKNEIGRPSDNLTEMNTNLRYGCRILQFYLAREKGNLRKALARYNGSVGKTWYSELVMNAWFDYWIAGDL